MSIKNYEVNIDDHGVRLDRWFKIKFPLVPYNYLQKIIRKGIVRIDGKRVKPSNLLKKGQIIKLPDLDFFSKPEEKIISNKDIEFINSLVIYKDDNIIAINKPAGLAVQGGSKVRYHVDFLLEGLKIGNESRPKIVHRLDKDTSGVLLIARNRHVAAKISHDFHSSNIKKTYIAIVENLPPQEEGEISVSIRNNKEIMVIDEINGIRAITHYKLLKRLESNRSLLELNPITGRKHQLRIHCKYIGVPIVGDRKYGDKKPTSSNLMLHAKEITINDYYGKPLTIRADTPLYFDI